MFSISPSLENFCCNSSLVTEYGNPPTKIVRTADWAEPEFCLVRLSVTSTDSIFRFLSLETKEETSSSSEESESEEESDEEPDEESEDDASDFAANALLTFGWVGGGS